MSFHGWQFRFVEDLWEAVHTCEHCARERVRYVHTIEHPQHGRLRVGYVCAAKLTADNDTPLSQEKELRKRADRFNYWADPAHWKVEIDRHTRKGRALHWDYTFAAYRHGDNEWRWVVRIESQGNYHSDKIFRSAEEAKRTFWLKHIEKCLG